VLRWFRDDTRMRLLTRDAGLPISTAYRYLHEGITVLAAHARTRTTSSAGRRPRAGRT
jgi:hypothetical protein